MIFLIKVTDVMTQKRALKVTDVLTHPGNRCPDICHIMVKIAGKPLRIIGSNDMSDTENHGVPR